MKLDNAHSFYQNLTLNQSHFKFVGLSGISTQELLSLVEFVQIGSMKRWQLPDDLEELLQMSLFESYEGHLFLNLEKVKKNQQEFFLNSLAPLQGVIYLISTTANGIQSIYNEFKNTMLWLDLSNEKPWQKKDRFLFFLQAEAKKLGFLLDKQAATYLLDNEEGFLDRAKTRLELCALLAKDEKKISLELVQSLLPKVQNEVDFAWIDQLLFKKEPLEMPSCQDASELLLFLGQMRYVLSNALKLKSLVLKGISLDEMKPYFPKLSIQALSMQLKKIEDVSSDYLQNLLTCVFDKELELKQDFLQPASIFIELITKICEFKLCPKQES